MEKNNTKNNKYAHLSEPESKLDFHTLGILLQEEVKKIADEYIQKSKQNNIKRLLFITGKGLHSKDGEAKIKPWLCSYLQKHTDVKKVAEARRDRGGEGALEVTLI